MRLLRFAPLLLTLVVTACSLSKDIANMDDLDDYAAYADKWAPNEDAFVAVQRLATPALNGKDWKSAADIFEQWKPRFPLMERRFTTIIGMLRGTTQPLEIRNLGGAINTSYNEIKPSVTSDGSRLYFARDDEENGRGGLDIYVAQYENDAWQPAQNLGERINSKEHETINGLSFDGTMILIYGGFHGHLGNGDNYYFEKTPNGWSPIRHFPVPVNGNSWDSDGFITADGKALIFTSDRPGGVGPRVPKGTAYHGSAAGNSDIWVAVKRGNTWMAPINLGAVINTPYCERSAFLHPDGRTLYFSSDGHPGLGKLDVFKSVRLNENSWTEWSEPVNLGREINTPEDDWGYKVSLDGKYAYFSASDRAGGLGQNDIFMIELPTEARPASEVASVIGRITDENGNPVGADIFVQDLKTGAIEAQLRSDPETGEFMLTVPQDGKELGIFFEKEGYYPDSRTLTMNPDGTLATNIGGDGSGRDGDGSGRDGSGRDGDGSGRDGRDGNGGDRNGRSGSDRDGSGRDGRGNDRDGAGRDGSGRDTTGMSGSGRDGSGRDGSRRDGSGRDGDGSGRDGSGRDGSGRDGSGRDGSGRDGSSRDGSGRDGSGRDGFGDGNDVARINFDVQLKSVASMMSQRDKYGQLLAQRVNNIFFDFNRWELRPESFFELDRLVRFLETNAAIAIEIGAHTDDVGTDEYNNDLSRKRAQSVVDYLISKQVASNRLKAIGYGESRPEAPNDTEENRALNRRVEFRIAE